MTDADIVRAALIRADLAGLSLSEKTDALAALDRLEKWREKTAPIIASLAIYGDRAILSSLAEKARALNEATP